MTDNQAENHSLKYLKQFLQEHARPRESLQWLGSHHLGLRNSKSISRTAFPDSFNDPIAKAKDRSWWTYTRNLLILNILRSSTRSNVIWEVGSGVGSVASFLTNNGFIVVGVEPSSRAAEISSGDGIPTIEAQLEEVRLPSDSLELLGLFDVLEHSEDPVQLLAEIYRVTRPGGQLVLTVPASPLLWSAADVLAGHKLRYSKRLLRTQLKDAGFVECKIHNSFLLTYVPILLRRAIPFRLGYQNDPAAVETLSKSFGLPGRILTRLEVGLFPHLPFGSSLVAVATKAC